MRRELSAVTALFFLSAFVCYELSGLKLRIDKNEAGCVVWHLLFMF